MVDAGPWAIDDEASLVRCYDESLGEVYRYASILTGHDRAAADDLVQEVYLGLVRRCRTEAATIGMGWLLTSVRHRYLDRARGAGREDRRLHLVAAASGQEHEPQADASGVLSDLPERERLALTLRYLDDLPVGEVAALMGLSVHATESLLARARRRVRAREDRHA